MYATFAIAFYTILRKEIRRFLRIWVQTLLPPVITMTLYFVIFGNLIGRRIGDMGGYDYIQFIVPGLVMMAIINSSYSNVVSSFFGAKFQKNIEEMLVAPTPNWVMLSGYLAGGMARGLIVGILVSNLSMFFTSLTIQHIGITITVALFTALIFSLFGFINALFGRTFDNISIVPVFIITPLTYLGGVFYSIDLLPSFWRKVSLFNPILYLVNTFRYGLLGNSDIPVSYALLVICSFTIFLFCLSLWLLNRSVGIRS